MKCSRKDCQNEATNSVTAELRVHKKHPPALSTPLLYVCDDHALDVTWSEVITDQWFNELGNRFTQSGFAAPVKKYSNLVIKPI
jgi:hypothetical protein